MAPPSDGGIKTIGVFGVNYGVNILQKKSCILKVYRNK